MSNPNDSIGLVITNLGGVQGSSAMTATAIGPGLVLTAAHGLETTAVAGGPTQQVTQADFYVGAALLSTGKPPYGPTPPAPPNVVVGMQVNDVVDPNGTENAAAVAMDWALLSYNPATFKDVNGNPIGFLGIITEARVTAMLQGGSPPTAYGLYGMQGEDGTAGTWPIKGVQQTTKTNPILYYPPGENGTFGYWDVGGWPTGAASPGMSGGPGLIISSNTGLPCIYMSTSGNINGGMGHNGGPSWTPDTINSLETKGAFLGDSPFMSRLYYGMLGRVPDPAGLSYWSQLLFAAIATTRAALGMTGALYPSILQVLNANPSLMQEWGSSLEWEQANAGLTAQEFATKCYADLFGRAPDQAGLNYWVSVLNDGGNAPVTQAYVAGEFAASDEAWEGFGQYGVLGSPP